MLGLEQLAKDKRENRTEDARRGPPARGVMSFDFESDESSTVKSQVQLPEADTGSYGAALSATSAAAKKRPRSFLVKAAEPGDSEDKKWDGSNFGTLITTPSTLSGGSRARWGVSTTSASSMSAGGSTTPGGFASAVRGATGVWGGPGSDTAPIGSVIPPREGGEFGEEDEDDFDRDYYGMVRRLPGPCDGDLHFISVRAFQSDFCISVCSVSVFRSLLNLIVLVSASFTDSAS